jgi:hypothetical protein
MGRRYHLSKYSQLLNVQPQVEQLAGFHGHAKLKSIKESFDYFRLVDSLDRTK